MATYSITVNFLPENSSFYVMGDQSNPVTIDSGKTATLKFIADGTFFTLLKNTSNVSVSGANKLS